MKKNIISGIAFVLVAIFFASCEKDDNLKRVDNSFKDALSLKYPAATHVEWEKAFGYYVAEFWDNGTEYDVWYDENAQWCMTETDMGRNVSVLPEAVKTTFESGEYAKWKVDDIDKYERPGEILYLIEVEMAGKRDRDLYYNESGMLLKDAEDGPSLLPDTKL